MTSIRLSFLSWLFSIILVSIPKSSSSLYIVSLHRHMWPPWLRSTSRLQSTPPPSPSPSHARARPITFSCSSFKDIQSLCQEQPEPGPQPPKSSSLFRRVRISTAVLRAWGSRGSLPSSQPSITLPGSDEGVVIYYTSLRVVRRTFEDCRAVGSILRAFRVSIDERDVSMDDRFLDELQEILGRRTVTLPRVFIGGRYIGGAEDVRQMHENGELRRLIERLPRSDPNACDLCEGLRFVVCDECSGSHKVYTEKSGFRSCTACNVNGLIRCPSCSLVLSGDTKS